MRLLYLTCLCIMLNSTVVQAQSTIDSLNTALEAAVDKKNKIAILLQLSLEHEQESLEKALEVIHPAMQLADELGDDQWQAKTYTQYGDLIRFQSDYDKAITIYEKALKLAESVDLHHSQSLALTGIATCYLRKGDFDNALEYQAKHTDLAKAIDNKEVLAGSYNTTGNIYSQLGEYTKAMEHYTLSSKLYQELKRQDDIATTFANIGMVQRLSGNYESAKGYFIQSDSIFAIQENQAGRAFVFDNLAIVFRNLEQIDKAIEYNQKALGIYEKTGNKHRIALTFYNLGGIYFADESYADAINNYEKSLVLFGENKDSVYLAYAFSAIGEAYVALNQDKKAESYFVKAIKISKSINLNLIAMDASEALSKIYASAGEFAKAYESQLDYAIVRDSLYTKEKRTLADEIEAKYQNEQKAKEISLLASENKYQALQIQKRENERNYLIVIALVILLVAVLAYNQYRTKQKANAKLRELDRMKSDFFANISHEFRTPLSLIMAPLKEKLADAEDEKEMQEYQMMYRNADRLFNLINQLLDLSKLEAGNITLEKSAIEISHCFTLIAASFSSYAAYKNIQLHVNVATKKIWVELDEDVIQNICYNLLSNALKFTLEGGEVWFNVKCTDNLLTIQVKDTGVGIAPEDQEKVFDRFFQSPTNNQPGTGIGLALTKQLVEFHQGKIRLEANDVETNFLVEIPVEQIQQPVDVELSIPPALIEASKTIMIWDEKEKEAQAGPVILVIEDNPDLRNYVGSLFQENYIIHQSKDGELGIKQAKKIIPDLIISDVMMPGKDGMEVCKELKQAKETGHIPIILLTARADQQSKLDGLGFGADDYLLKPFDPKELKLRVSNLLQQRNKLKEKYTKLLSLKPADIEISSSQEVFLKEVMEVVNKNIDNSEFSVTQFCEAIGMSRMQLHRKLTAMTGKSASAFLRHQRLIRASQLLAAGEPVSQTAYAVGFESLSYFTKVFKEAYGVVPSEYEESKD